MNIFAARSPRETQLAETQVLTDAERRAATELPGTRAAREAAEAALAARSIDAVRAKHEAGRAYQRARKAEFDEWADWKRDILHQAEVSETARFHAIGARDLEAAIAADERARSLRALLPSVDAEVRRLFGGGMNLAGAVRV